MPLDHYVTLGRSGLRVSPFCLGTMTFGTQWGFGSESDDVAAKVLTTYLEHGGNFLDTANMYTKGYSEHFIGKYFDKGGRGEGQRDRVVIATKFMGNMYRGDPNGGGANRKSIMNACEESLRRLRTDHIDLYWAHFWDKHTPIEEVMHSMDLLVQQGKVRYIGFSDHPAWVCVKAQAEANLRNWTPLVALQIEYSLAERTVEGELMPMARDLGLGVTPWSPLKGGILAGRYRRGESHPENARYKEDSRYLTEATYGIIDELVAIGEEVEASPAQVALAWVRDRAGVDSTIIGARTVEQLESNLAGIDLALSAEQTGRLDAASEPTLSFPHGFLENIPPVIQGGTTVNGVATEVSELSPESDGDRW